MKLSDIGEFGLIHRFAPQFLHNLPDNIRGIGDDCAVIPQNKNESLLVTTDLLIEDIHFLRHKISARELGHKSLAVNLSDIAAMGGAPIAAFLSIGLPKDVEIAWLDDFFAGIYDLSQKTAAPLLGGDTTKSKDRIVINIAVLGKAHPANIKYRSTALPGDIICVTDNLGDSGGGLNIILNNLEEDTPEIRQLMRAHHLPSPQLAQGQWLAQQPSVHAMLDVSDGIDSDIRRIMEESSVGARVEIDKIPMSGALQKTANRFSWNAVELAATGGEDYCLLCTIAPEHFARIAAEFGATFGTPLFQIGRIEAGGNLVYEQQGSIIDFSKHGWDHFK